MLTEIFLGGLIRIVVSYSPVNSWLTERVEISTPITSWKRIEEGLTLYKLNLNPYDGDVVHEPPITLFIYGLIRPLAGLLFIALDIMTAILVSKSAESIHQMMVEDENKKPCHKSFTDFQLKLNKDIGYYSLLAVLFNPYSIAICSAKSTQCTLNFLYSLTLFGIAKNNVILISVATGISSYISLFPVMILFPVLMHHRDDTLRGITSFIGTFTILHMLSYQLTGGFGYLESVYGFVLEVSDYTPNVGAAWYFFAEMFSHFTTLFLIVYQVNLVLYAVPLSLRFPDNPPLVVFALLMLLALFKPYTTVGDYVIPYAMFPLWLHLFKYLDHFFIVAIATIVLTLLWPILWYLWVHCLNANSNFYFAITLAFVLFQSFLLSDVLFAEMRRSYARENGVKRKKIDGVNSVVSLD